MEALLSVAFDNISSRESLKIRKGLRQIEGVLAQICLSKSTAPKSPHKRTASVLSDKAQASPKMLRELRGDAAFREFFRLQEGFQWNGMLLKTDASIHPTHANQCCSGLTPHFNHRTPHGYG